MVENVEVFEGPTPFISFVHARVSDPANFEFAQFLIWPKTASATRPVKVRYARSYLEARGYFDPQHSQPHRPCLWSLRWSHKPRHVNLGFNSRIHPARDSA